MTLIKPLLWWAYLDDRGIVHIKKYMSDKQLQNCEQMPFCRGIFDPFEAWDREDAKVKIMKFLDEAQYYEKKEAH